MASSLHIYICSFLLAVIAGHEFLLAEARQPKTLKKQNVKSFEEDKGLIDHSKELIGSSKVSEAQKGDLHETGPIDSYDVYRTKEVLPQISSNGPRLSPELGSALTVNVNGFQPTTPGNSPGVGHSHIGRKQIEQKAPSTATLAYSIEANTDDFRPTAPGRSPGVGHSIRNTKAEPNP